MQTYQVGQRLRNWKPDTPEGLHYNYMENAHSVMVVLDRPTRQEIDDFKFAPAEFAFREDEGLITFIIRIGTIGPGNAHYNWWNVPAEQRTVPPMETNREARPLVTLFLVDRKTGTLQAMRVLTWSSDFSRRLEEEIRRQATHPEYDSQGWVAVVINRLYERYPDLEAMKDQTLVSCLGGE